MWQLAWMWSLIPTSVITFVVNGLVVIGLIGVCASWIARWIPFVNTYRGPVQLIGIICLVLGVYLKGGADVEVKWRTQTAELQAKADKAAEESKTANNKLAVEVKKNQQLNKDVKDAVKASIKASANKMDSQCTVDSVAIELHNRSSRNEVPRGTTGIVTVVPSPGANKPVGTQVK
jgi:hypothetical protein